MKSETFCLIGLVLCLFFGAMAAKMGDIIVATTWLVGVIWAFIASRYAKQVDTLTFALNEAIEIMEETKRVLE